MLGNNAVSIGRRLPLFAATFLVMGILVFASGDWAQQAAPGQTQANSQDTSRRMQESELTRRNLGRVAASVGEIRAVLATNAGLLVELKRWIAQDAANRGQLVEDSDLTDDAIFERLETDVEFRSVATQLLQRYGYLVAKVNPDSEIGRERELELQQRARWMAQPPEQGLTQTRASSAPLQNVQNTPYCGPQNPDTCGYQPPMAAPQPGSQGSAPPGGAAPPQAQPPQPGSGGNLMTAEAQGQAAPPPDQDVTDMFFPLSGLQRTTASTGPAPNYGGSDQSPVLAAYSTIGESSPDFGSVAGVPNLPYASSNPEASNGPQPAEKNFVSQPGATPARVAQPTRAAIQPLELVRRADPYTDVPSLFDMYLQATPNPVKPVRFGEQVFENGTRNSEYMPMDMPAGPDYILGPGDGLSIYLWGSVSQRLTRTVDREGRISLPEVGPLLVAGKSLAQVQDDAERALRSQYRDISLDVSLSRLRTVRIYEVGDVAKPGAYDISSLSTPLSALFQAGGPTARGSMRIVKHYRGNQLLQVVDVYDLLLNGVKGNLDRLENGDTILIPPIGPQVTVQGMVRRPAVYELRNEKSLMDVLDLAGGLLPSAALRHIEVERTVEHEKRSMLSLDIPDDGNRADVTKELQSFEIQDGDSIRIFPIDPYDQDAIYLDGHVVRPGKYSYHANMRVTDVIGSYKDLLPEPAAHYAEIIRLNAPDFRPAVESFDLDAALRNPAEAPLLHPLDTIRIFSRFDFQDPPTVSVLGEVRAPGKYRTSGQVRLSDAIYLAGGLGPDATTSDAQVFRYLPDGKSEIFSVSVSQALLGDPVANILLNPRDRILIHRNSEAVDPESVSIEGDVANPGRYPLTTNLRVADLVRTAGGLKPSADPGSADLVQYEWSDQMKFIAQHRAVDLKAALSGAANADVLLRNGDVLTIRERPGWDDLGASVVLKGEVKHPGTYGIRPGERLSSVVERAGGFQPDAYPRGAILQRVEVRQLQTKAQEQMLMRIRQAQAGLQNLPQASPEQQQAKYVALQQWQSAVNDLSANPPPGRVVVHISENVSRWRNGPSDIEVRSGDTLFVPRRPNVVNVVGEVYSPTSVIYRPGKSAGWYLGQAGGPTMLANKKAIFVIRADGSVVGSKRNLVMGESLSTALEPGDTVVVPDRALGGGMQWQTLLLGAQVASSMAATLFIALHY